MTAIGEGWFYRKKITINSGTELTNYQLKFTVNRSAGTDSAFTVYVGTKCQSDYDDIRFTNSSGTILDYWIESTSTTTSTGVIWVEIDSIASGNTTIYLYYGNPGASAVSSGANTFEFFDDFPGTSLSASWTSTGTVAVADSVVSLYPTNTSTGYYIKTTSTWGVGYAIRAYCKAISQTATYPEFGWGYAEISRETTAGYEPASSKIVFYSSDGTRSSVDFGAIDTNYHTFDFIRVSNSQSYGIQDGGSAKSITTHIPTDSLPFAIRTYYASGTKGYAYCDWVAVRKYAATEPTISAWGNEISYARSGIGFGSANMMMVG